MSTPGIPASLAASQDDRRQARDCLHSGAAQYPAAAGQYPATEQYPAAGQYRQQGPFGLTSDVTAPGQYAQSPSPFPPAQYPGYPDQTVPESTTAIERPSGQEPPDPAPSPAAVAG